MDTTSQTTNEKVVGAVLAYYRLASAFPATIPEALTWFDTLPPESQKILAVLLPQEWLSFPDLQRYQLERHGIFLHAYMTTNLTPHEVEYWLLHGDGGIGDGGIM